MAVNSVEQIRVVSSASCSDEDRLEITRLVTRFDPNLAVRFQLRLQESQGPSILDQLKVEVVGQLTEAAVVAVVGGIAAWRHRRIKSGGSDEPATVDLLGPKGEVLKTIVLDDPPEEQ